MEIVQTSGTAASLDRAMANANIELRSQLATCTGDLEKVSLSHSSGFVPGVGFFVTIMATVPAKTAEPGIASMF